MITDTKTILVETLTVSETAAYLGVSPRTVERYAVLKGYKALSEIRNGRRVNVYERQWVDLNFTPVGQRPGQVIRQVSDNVPSEIVTQLNNEVDFLKKEIEVKNQVINKLQDSQSKLLESDKNTKTCRFKIRPYYLNQLQLQLKRNRIQPKVLCGYGLV